MLEVCQECISQDDSPLIGAFNRGGLLRPNPNNPPFRPPEGVLLVPVVLVAAPPVVDCVLRLLNIRSTDTMGNGSLPLPLLLQAAAYVCGNNTGK